MQCPAGKLWDSCGCHLTSDLRWGLHRSALLRDVPWILDWIGIWGIWRPGQRLELMRGYTWSAMVLGVLCLSSVIHMSTRPQGFQAEHCSVTRRLFLLFISPVSSFNVLADSVFIKANTWLDADPHELRTCRPLKEGTKHTPSESLTLYAMALVSLTSENSSAATHTHTHTHNFLNIDNIKWFLLITCCYKPFNYLSKFPANNKIWWIVSYFATSQHLPSSCAHLMAVPVSAALPSAR